MNTKPVNQKPLADQKGFFLFEFAKSFFSAPVRISSILIAILFAALGNNILVVMLPINLEETGVNVQIIGVVMSGYSVGILLGSIYSHSVISRVGHNRSYAAVAALVSCAAIAHMHTQSMVLLMSLRFLVGLSMAVIYITLESWLNATSERESRGFIFALYQFFFAIGVFLSPFSISFLDPLDKNSFAIVALFLSFSLIPISLSRFASPQMVDSQKRLSIIEMILDTPSGSITAIISGLGLSALYIFSSIYANGLGFSEDQMALLIATAMGSAIVFQIPVGKLADKFDERKILLVISLICLSASIYTYYISLIDLDWKFYLLGVFFVGGSLSCLYPLSVNFIFEQIDSNKAIAAMSSLLILNSFGLIFGPVLCSIFMNYIGSEGLFVYLGVLMSLFTVFITYRVYVSETRASDHESIPYVITFQMLRPGNYNFDPRSDYNVGRIKNPVLITLANSIAISPNKTQKLIQKNLEFLKMFTPEELLLALVMHKPRRAKEIAAALANIYPEKRIDLTYALKDLLSANKAMINHLLQEGLKLDADAETSQEIDELFVQFAKESEAKPTPKVEKNPKAAKKSS